MNFKLTIFLLLISVSNLFGQPGWAWKVQGNLNEIDSTTLLQCFKDGDLCYFGEIVIDSTTNLNRLDQISFLESVLLIINLPSIPNEFKNVKFSNLKQLKLHCGKNLSDLGNLEYLTYLEDLQISGFMGNSVDIDFSKFINLRSFTMYSAPNVEQLDKVFASPKLEGINLWILPSLKLLTTDTLNKNITGITLRDCPLFQIENIKYFQSLKYFGISGTDFSNVPDYFSKNLIVLSVSKNKTLVDIKSVSLYKNLKEYNFKDNPLIKDKHKKRRN